MQPLTKRQYSVFDFAATFIAEKGFSPSFAELGKGLGLSSLATVAKHVTTLCSKGYLSHDYNRSRSLKLTREAEIWHRRRVAKNSHQCPNCAETARVLDEIVAHATPEAIRNAVGSVSTGIKAVLRAHVDPQFAKEVFVDRGVING